MIERPIRAAAEADFVVVFPPAAERARLRSRSAAPPARGSYDPPRVTSPAAGSFGSSVEDQAAGAFWPSTEYPDLPAALDRPSMRPDGNAGGAGDTLPPASFNIGVSGSPVAGLSILSAEPASNGAETSHTGAAPGPSAAGEGGSLPALPGTGAGGSIASVLAKRLEHVALGYDAAHDARLPPTHLVDSARKYLTDAHDLVLRREDPARIRLKLVNAAALALAAIDLHDSLHTNRDAPASSEAIGQKGTPDAV